MSRYDLVVLGGGTAGLVASTVAASLGARVVLVEQAEQAGGDCLFTGCVPSKSLIASAKLAHSLRTADRLGLEPREPQFDFARVMERVQAIIEQAGVRDTAEHLESQGVEVVRAAGRFGRPGLIEADGRRLPYRAALIATGSRPALPPIPGLAEADPLTNETVWALRELPARLAILGGGPTGVELGQAFARLGSRVVIVEAGPEHPLRFVDEEVTGGLKPSVLVRGRLEALVARPVMYELVEHGEEIEVGGRRMFAVRSKGAVYPIMPAEKLQRLSA